MAVPALDTVHTDVVGQLDGRAQAPQRGHVRTANPLEAFGAELCVIPTFGRNRVPESIHDLVTHKEKSRAFGRLQPLVRARGVHVAPEFLDVEAHGARNVSSVYR